MSAEEIKSFLENILRVIRLMTLSDVVDILCVTVILYYMYKFIRERRAGRLAFGLVFLFIIQLISKIGSLYVMQFLMQNVFQVGILTIVVLFQPELRSALEKVGAQPLKGLKTVSEKENAATLQMIAEVTEALCDLSEAKTGALMVFERATKLGDRVGTGTVIDAYPASFLIKNIFYNKAPMHDGAVIVRNNRLYAAGCLLPVSENLDIVKDLGTRHRAAIGMSENSDALVLVVSEETGCISAALEGVLTRNYTKETLTDLMRRELLGNTERGMTRLGKIAHAVESRTFGRNGG